MASDYAIEDIDETGHLTRDYVEARVNDWLGRLDRLFGDVRAWGSAHGWAVADIGTIAMHEELMERVGMGERRQPMLRLEAADGRYAWFKPKGLWVIGANGRIDLYTGKGIALLVDAAERFAEPDWRLYRGAIQAEDVPFAPDLIERLA